MSIEMLQPQSIIQVGILKQKKCLVKGNSILLGKYYMKKLC